jgi:hypothetical protein
MNMILIKRPAVAAAIAAATVAGVIGCSHAATQISSSTTGAAEPVSATSQAMTPPMPQAPAPAAVIEAAINAQGSTNVKLGGPPMRFTVTLVNNGPDVPGVGLVVSMGHCSCGPPGASMMARGTMRRLDPQTNEWVKAPYVRQGTGMDFITGNLVAPFPLEHGQTVSYQLELQLDANQDNITDGDGGVEVTLANPDNPMEGARLGKSAFLPITVQV